MVSTGRRNTGGQLAINNDDGLPNGRPIAFSEPSATSYPTTQFSLPPSYHHEISDLSAYNRSFPSKIKCCVDRLSWLPESGHTRLRLACPLSARKRHAGHSATMRLTRLGGRARSSQRARSRSFPRISGRVVSVALTPSLCLSVNTWFPPFPRHRAAKPDFLFRCYSNPGL